MLSNTEEKSYKPVQSIERTFKILEVLAKNPEGLSLQALSEKTDLPSSTVHRLLHTLYALGYTEWRKSNSSPYKLTLRLFEYGCYSLENRGFVQRAHPFLKRLSEELKVSASIFFANGQTVVCAMQYTQSSVSSGPSLGECIPMHCCAAGKCILSLYSPRELRQYLDNSSTAVYTPKTKAAAENLEADLKIIRNQGWALVDEEYKMGEACVAVPMKDKNNIPAGAMGIHFISGQYSRERIGQWIDAMKQYSEVLMSNQ